MTENHANELNTIQENTETSNKICEAQKKSFQSARRKNLSGKSKIAWLEDENTSRKNSQIEVDNILNSLKEFESTTESTKSEVSRNSVESGELKKESSVDSQLFFVPKDSESENMNTENNTKLQKVIVEEPSGRQETRNSSVFTDTRNSTTSEDLNSDKMLQEMDNIILGNRENKKISECNEDKTSSKKILAFDPLAGPPFRCAGCFNTVEDELCKTELSIWHPEHFNCVICGRSLIDDAFFEVDYELYCELDYEIRFLKKCKNCDNFIYDEMISVDNQNFHPDHFVCSKCNISLCEQQYFVVKDSVVCEGCYAKDFAPKCGGCGKPVLTNSMKVLGATWHSNCFCCKTCLRPFSGGLFHIYGKDAYCELHYHEIRGTICFGCKNPITGTFVTACDRKFHPEHLVCSYCKKKLTGTSYKEFQGKPYCVSCSSNLVS